MDVPNTPTKELLEYLEQKGSDTEMGIVEELVKREDTVRLINDTIQDDSYWEEERPLHMYALFLLGMIGSAEAFDCIDVNIVGTLTGRAGGLSDRRSCFGAGELRA